MHVRDASMYVAYNVVHVLQCMYVMSMHAMYVMRACMSVCDVMYVCSSVCMFVCM